MKYTIPVSDIIVVVVMGSTFPSRYLLSLFFIFLLSSSPTTLSLVTSVASFGESPSSSFLNRYLGQDGRVSFLEGSWCVRIKEALRVSLCRRDFRSLSTLCYEGNPSQLSCTRDILPTRFIPVDTNNTLQRGLGSVVGSMCGTKRMTICWTTCVYTNGVTVGGYPSPEGENLYTARNITNGGSGTGCGKSNGLRGVDPEGVDLPVSIYECLGLLVDD